MQTEVLRDPEHILTV